MITGELKSNYGSDEFIWDNIYKKVFLIISLIFLILLPFFSNDYVILLACRMLIILTAVVGVNVVMGYTGQMSLGHAAFIAIGAYVTCIFYNLTEGLIPLGIMPFISIPLSMFIAALVGLIVGLPSLRVKGIYLAVATLSANFIIIFIIEQPFLSQWTGGLVGIDSPNPNLFGWEMDTKREKYWLVMPISVFLLLFAQNLFRTRIGRAFIAIRDSDYSAEILGISLYNFKLLSFAISAAYCGAAGALWAYFFARILPEQFELLLSLQLVVALIVGGMGRTMGPVLGVILVLLVPELLKMIFGLMPSDGFSVEKLRAPLQEITFGILIIGFILFEPLGLVAITDRFFRFLNRWPFAQ